MRQKIKKKPFIKPPDTLKIGDLVIIYENWGFIADIVDTTPTTYRISLFGNSSHALFDMTDDTYGYSWKEISS